MLLQSASTTSSRLGLFRVKAMWSGGSFRILLGNADVSDIDLVTPYHEYFNIKLADTDELRDRVFRLRYDVYCRELGWEDPAVFPDGREIDEFDETSIQCLLIHRPSGREAGAGRLVRPGRECPVPCLPLLTHYDPALFNSDQSPLKQLKGCFGEISRLALREQFRRRPGERDTPDGHGPELFDWTLDDRRRFPHIALGLYLAAATVGLAEGMTSVYAMMEPRLARHLHFGGIYFEPVGEAIEFRGARAPFHISRAMLFKNLTPPLLALLEAIAEDLGVQV